MKLVKKSEIGMGMRREIAYICLGEHDKLSLECVMGLEGEIRSGR